MSEIRIIIKDVPTNDGGVLLEISTEGDMGPFKPNIPVTMEMVSKATRAQITAVEIMQFLTDGAKSTMPLPPKGSEGLS